MRRHLTMAHCMRTSSRKMQWAQLTSMWPLRIQTMPQVQTAVDQLGMGLRYTHKPSVDRQVFKLDAKVSSCSTDHLAIQAESEQHQHRRARGHAVRISYVFVASLSLSERILGDNDSLIGG